ncbi:MAG: DNA-protecting protein DprA [Eubacteriaceae bacterium]|nr:DNA-protecting protein DprA [Eubacteriaceae bacterium]
MLYSIWLSRIKGIGTHTQKKLLERFIRPEAIYDADFDELLSVPGVGEAYARGIKNARLDDAEIILENCSRLGIKVLEYTNPRYPEKAKELDSPILLYYKGTIRENCVGVGIVGARRCTAYGKEVAREAAKNLAEKGIVVISGMARGIDGYAHTACIKAGGYTMAFLGCSPDICYPKEHDMLMGAIIENGAVVSEYPPETKVRAEYFPQRNLLIGNFSSKLLVVEAGKNSGALITANYAMKIGREVYAVPNSIYAGTAVGTNQLIKEGAKIYTKASDLTSENQVMETKIPLGCTPAKRSEKINLDAKVNLGELEIRILGCLKEAKTISQLAEEVECLEKELLETISLMEIMGVIKTLAGGKISL